MPILNRQSGNNLYYNGSNYHDFHANSIVLPWLNGLQKDPNRKWEDEIRRNIDEQDKAGFFEYINPDTNKQNLYTSYDDRARRIQDQFNTTYSEFDKINGSPNNQRFYTSNSRNRGSGDRFDAQGNKVGYGNSQTDNFYGVQTAILRVPVSNLCQIENTYMYIPKNLLQN